VPYGASFLPEYRIYEFTISRQLATMSVIICESDEQAIEQAKTMLNGRDLEVRQGFRVVIQLRSSDK